MSARHVIARYHGGPMDGRHESYSELVLGKGFVDVPVMERPRVRYGEERTWVDFWGRGARVHRYRVREGLPFGDLVNLDFEET